MKTSKKFGKYWLIFLVSLAFYAILVGNFVSPDAFFSVSILEIKNLLFPGVLLVISAIAAVKSNQYCCVEKSTVKAVAAWIILVVSFVPGIYHWLVISQSPFMAWGLVPVFMIPFLSLFIKDVPFGTNL